MKFSKTLFWNMYARCYDAIALLQPYQDLLQNVVDKLPNTSFKMFDAGCGTGNLLFKLCKTRNDITAIGIDFSDTMISIARKKVRHATFTQASLADSLPFPDKTFDVVTCVKVLFAVPNPGFTISELKRVLKDDGILILDTPKAGWSMRPILKEHVKQVGWFKTIPVLLRLLVLAGFNLFIFSKGDKNIYHFMDLSQFKRFFNSPIKSAYASQDWFTCADRTSISV